MGKPVGSYKGLGNVRNYYNAVFPQQLCQLQRLKQAEDAMLPSDMKENMADGFVLRKSDLPCVLNSVNIF